jgi:hypothetical protein
MNWNLIIHREVHQGNIFLCWEDDDDLLPPLAWKTGGLSFAAEGPADINRQVLVDPEALDRDLAHLIYKLRQLNDACPGTLEKKHGPIHELRKPRKEARQVAKRDKELPVAQYVAERMCPLAKQIIKKLEDEDPADLRWTLSLGFVCALTFMGDEQSRESTLRHWAGVENYRKSIEKPRVWIDVEKLPRSIPW